VSGPVTFDITTRRGRERAREVWAGCKVSSLSEDELDRAHAAGYEPGPDGHLVGRDPRTMTPDELRAMGFQPKSPMQIIRAKCLDCAGTAQEVRFCTSMTCENWLARTGKNPWRAPPSEALREARRERALKIFGKSSDAVNGAVASDEDAPGRIILPTEPLRSPEPGKIEASPAAPRPESAVMIRRNRPSPSISILDACDSPEIWRGWFKHPQTWAPWRTFLSVLFGLPLGAADLRLYRQCTGREHPPAGGFTEAWLVIGRRGGKSFALALIACYLAIFRDWRPYLSPGEIGMVTRSSPSIEGRRG
jgi:hypothetical protein